MPEGGLPVEEVLHPKTVEMLHNQASTKDDPVRADKLQAITPAEALTRRTFDGESLPSMPRPRRVIPAPFQRTRVAGGQHGKSWRPVEAIEVFEGDMHEGVGRVAHREFRNGRVVLVGKGGLVSELDAGTATRVFR
jgi:hypothetical protein